MAMAERAASNLFFGPLDCAHAVDLFLTRGEKLMDELHRHRSFADRGRDALDRTLPHIAGRKNARHRCLQKKWLPLQWPGAGLSDLLSGLHEALAIQIDRGRQPFRVSTSPVNCLGPSTVTTSPEEPSRISTSPLLTTNNFSSCSPAASSVSPTLNCLEVANFARVAICSSSSSGQAASIFGNAVG
jgi:hypothetical protein